MSVHVEAGAAPPGVSPVLQVGMIGHRALPDQDPDALQAAVRAVLTEIRDAAAGKADLRAVCALAAGADLLLGAGAVREGWTLFAPLPFPREVYRHDLTDDESRAEYDRLLGEAARVYELAGDPGSAIAYQAVGRLLLEQSDVVVAIWDGQPEKGIGGTGQIVREALEGHIPVIVISSDAPHAVRVLERGAHRPQTIGELVERLLRVDEPVRAGIDRYLREDLTKGVRVPRLREAVEALLLGLPSRRRRVGRPQWPDPPVLLPALTQIDAVLRPHFEFADRLAVRYGGLYRFASTLRFLVLVPSTAAYVFAFYWPAYEAGLRRRGDLTLWLDEAAVAGWSAPKRSTPGGQPSYSDLAIELVLTLRLVFHLALRQAEAFTCSVLRLLGVGLPVPDHTTLSRRGYAFAGRQPRVTAGSGPVHLVLDSTGLQLFGQGEWDAEKHGRMRRRWLKLHLAINATTGEIAAHKLTEGTADDAAQVPALLGQAKGTIASVTADSAYDGEPVYAAAAVRQRDPPPDVVVPPRASAVPSTDDPAKQSPRDRHIRFIMEHGRMAWQRATDYGRRSLGGTAVGRYKHLIGPKLRARKLPGQQGEVALAVQALNRIIQAAKPVSVRICCPPQGRGNRALPSARCTNASAVDTVGIASFQSIAARLRFSEMHIHLPEFSRVRDLSTFPDEVFVISLLSLERPFRAAWIVL